MIRGLRPALRNPFAWLLALTGVVLVATGVWKFRYSVALQTGRERYPDIDDIGYTYALINEGFRLAPWYVGVGLLCVVCAVVAVALRVQRR